MNYVILNDFDFYNNINIKGFKEVFIDGRDRIDGVFGSITSEILESLSDNNGDGNSILREQWLCSDSGTVFVVLKIPQDILYSNDGKFIKECFGFFNPQSFYLELGCIKLEDQEKYEYFIIAYKKSLGFQLIFKEAFIEKKEEEIVPFLCETIERIL